MKKFFRASPPMAILLLSVAVFSLGACQTAELSPVVDAPQISPTPAVNSSPIPSVSASPAAQTSERKTSEPYTGDLSIFEGEDRAKNLQIDRVMDILNISEGKTIADIGAGSGWFTVRAARRAGEKGKVYAVEINREYVEHIRERAKRENFKNIETVLGAPDDPKLPADKIDAALILKTYHEIAEPVKVLNNLKKALKSGAFLGVIDKNGAGDDHGIAKETIIAEAKSAGFALVGEYDFVKPDGMDYFLVFRVEKMLN